MTIHRAQLAGMIDHTLLKPEATAQQIETLCREARENALAAVCVNPSRVAQAERFLRGSDVAVCTVCGFPLGATAPSVKAFEAHTSVDNGAREIDMVIDIGALKDGNHQHVEEDIRAVVRAVAGVAIVKVILETCLLSVEEVRAACRLAQSAGAQFVKTSTGFSAAGASVEHVCLMRQTVGVAMGVKAAGGIRDFATATSMIEAGANRIGTTASLAILAGAPQ